MSLHFSWIDLLIVIFFVELGQPYMNLSCINEQVCML